MHQISLVVSIVAAGAIGLLPEVECCSSNDNEIQREETLIEQPEDELIF